MKLDTQAVSSSINIYEHPSGRLVNGYGKQTIQDTLYDILDKEQFILEMSSKYDANSENQLSIGNGLLNNEPSFSNRLKEMAIDIAEHTNKQKADYTDSLLKAAETSDPIDILRANREMSNYQLEMLMATKVISKATSVIERLTNLQ